MNLIEHSLDLQIPMNPSYDHLFRNSPDAVSIPVKKEIDSHLLGLVHLKGDKTMTKLVSRLQSTHTVDLLHDPNC